LLAAAAYATGATFDANGVPFEGPWPHAAANRFKSMGGKRKGVCPPEEGKFAPGSLQASIFRSRLEIHDDVSGTAFGTVVLHVTPESALGGPLAHVRNGDRIRLRARLIKSPGTGIAVSEA